MKTKKETKGKVQANNNEALILARVSTYLFNLIRKKVLAKSKLMELASRCILRIKVVTMKLELMTKNLITQ